MASPSSPALLADAAFFAEAILLAGGGLDVVGVFDGSRQVFAQARPLKASLRETSRIMEHPAETGTMLADHKVIDPVEVELPLIIPSQFYGAMYQQIKSAFTKSTLLSVKTPVNLYENMVIAAMPHEEDPEHFDAIAMSLYLRQIIFFAPGAPQALPANYSPAKPADRNTVQSGVQQPTGFAGGGGDFGGRGATGSW